MHVAGFKYAGVSVQRPLHTYEQNVDGTLSVLRAMLEAGVDKVVSSSSAATYGTPEVDTVTESTPTAPESPYGESKLIGEWLLSDQAAATGLRHTSLRYFNVVGSGTPEVYDTSPHNLFPLVIEALLEDRTPRINGEDYPARIVASGELAARDLDWRMRHTLDDMVSSACQARRAPTG